MYLKYSDVKWRWLKATDVGYRLLRISDISSRYVFSHYQADKTTNREKISVRMQNPAKDSSEPVDAIRLAYVGKLKDFGLLSERMVFTMSSSFVEARPAVDVMSVRMSSPSADAVLPSDRIVTTFGLVVRDAVGLNESFFFGGIFNVDIHNVVFPQDKVSGGFEKAAPDSAILSEFVRVGIRHMIDFYLGGFALGSVVFGGRIR